MKKIVLLAGVALVSGTIFAGEFKFTNEAKLNDQSNYSNSKKTEWTLAKGHYRFDNGLEFRFDVDRDFTKYEDRNEDHEGWDTYAGLFMPVGSFEVGGLTFNNKIGIELLYDQEDSFDSYIGETKGKTDEKEETEVGFALESGTVLSETETFDIKLWGRNVKYEKGDIDEDEFIGGLELGYVNELNENWTFEGYLYGFVGGYYDGGSTFWKEDEDGDDVDEFNYDAEFYLTYNKDLYSLNDSTTIYFRNDIAAEYYGHGSQNKDIDGDSSEHWVQPNLGVKYEFSEEAKIFGEAGYKVIGSNDGEDNDEFEAKAGIKFTI